jgi:6-phospho-beta-glucosidase
MILCTENGGAIPTLKGSDIVEITCDITENGAMPHRFIYAADSELELIRQVKEYERLASKAIREKSKAAAVEALTVHPLVNSPEIAKTLCERYLELNKEYTYDWS